MSVAIGGLRIEMDSVSWYAEVGSWKFYLGRSERGGIEWRRQRGEMLVWAGPLHLIVSRPGSGEAFGRPMAFNANEA
jgi:hypothetical protein